MNEVIQTASSLADKGTNGIIIATLLIIAGSLFMFYKQLQSKDERSEKREDYIMETNKELTETNKSILKANEVLLESQKEIAKSIEEINKKMIDPLELKREIKEEVVGEIRLHCLENNNKIMDEIRRIK